MSRTYRVTLKYPDGSTMFMGTLMAEEIIEIPVKNRLPRTVSPPRRPLTNSSQ